MKRVEWASRSGRTSSFIARSTRLAIYHRDKFRCVYCGAPGKLPLYSGHGLSLDHIVAREEGGDHSPGNLITACIKCNCGRQAKRHTKPTLRRLLRIAAKPLNREVGRVLAEIRKERRHGPT